MGSVGLVLHMTNNVKYCLRSLLITLFISVILLIVLIPRYSAIVAAIAVSIGLIIWNVLMAIDVWKLTKLKTWIK
jgi:O-antigen/teichoic acid export membrane protein